MTVFGPKPGQSWNDYYRAARPAQLVARAKWREKRRLNLERRARTVGVEYTMLHAGSLASCRLTRPVEARWAPVLLWNLSTGRVKPPGPGPWGVRANDVSEVAHHLHVAGTRMAMLHVEHEDDTGSRPSARP